MKIVFDYALTMMINLLQTKKKKKSKSALIISYWIWS